MASATHDICRVCGQKFHPYPLGDLNGYHLTSCKACGSVVTDPIPTATEIEDYYGEIQPEAVHVTNPLGEIDYIARRLQKVLNKPAGASFLDANARQGYAVMAARKVGYKAKGLNTHEFLHNFAQAKYGTDLFAHATLQDYAAAGNKADIVMAIETFCEQPDLDAFTAGLAAVLNPGGVIYIEEPDGNHFNLPRDYTRWEFADPPFNFTYLSKKGMEKLLARHGLVIKKSYFTWLPYMRLVIGKK